MNRNPKPFFAKGNTYAKGKGRPKGSITSKRCELIHFLLDKLESEWPKLCEKLLEEAYKGNMKAFQMIFDFCMPSSALLAIEKEVDEAPVTEGTVDIDIDTMDRTELKALMNIMLQEAMLKEAKIKQEAQLIEEDQYKTAIDPTRH